MIPQNYSVAHRHTPMHAPRRVSAGRMPHQPLLTFNANNVTTGRRPHSNSARLAVTRVEAVRMPIRPLLCFDTANTNRHSQPRPPVHGHPTRVITTLGPRHPLLSFDKRASAITPALQFVEATPKVYPRKGYVPDLSDPIVQPGSIIDHDAAKRVRNPTIKAMEFQMFVFNQWQGKAQQFQWDDDAAEAKEQEARIALLMA